MTLIDQIVEVMSEHRGPAHVNEIANMLLELYPNSTIPAEHLPKKISAVLSADARKKASQSRFSKVKNKTGGFKRGVYRLKSRPIVTPVPTQAPKVGTQFTGKAGESAVISELLFYGYNASAMAVDDGIDVIASKQNSYFHIQVKTSNNSGNNGFGFTIQKSSFVSKDSFQTFYVFVLRDREGRRYFNDYLIIPSNQIRQFVEARVINDGHSLSIRIQIDSRGRYILNAKQDVTILINNFSQLT